MSTAELQQIRRRAQDVRTMISDKEAHLRTKPSDFAIKLTLSSLRTHLEDLTRQLILLEAGTERKLVELRLIGNQVTDGTIAIGLLAKLAGPLADVLHSTAYRLRYQNTDKPNAKDHIQKLMDVRLAGLGEGSTRLYLTGNVTPDLAGDSLFDTAMRQFFALLNAGLEDFFEAVHAMGPEAARAAENLLRAMESEEVSAELTWTSPDSQIYQWEGRSDRIVQLRSLLEQTEERQTEIIELRGSISLLSDTARMEIRQDGQSRATRIRYRKDQLHLIAGLTVGQRVVLEVEHTSFLDKSEQRVVDQYRLVQMLSR